MPLLTRRLFLPLLAAPAIIRVADLMTIKPIRNEFAWGHSLPNGEPVIIEPEPGRWIVQGDIVYQDAKGFWHKVDDGYMYNNPLATVDHINYRGDVAVGRLIKQGLVNYVEKPS